MGTELRIELFEPDADLEAVDELTRDLRLELLELDVDSVSPADDGAGAGGQQGRRARGDRARCSCRWPARPRR